MRVREPHPVIIMKIGVFILMRGPRKAIRNYYEIRGFHSSCVAPARPSAIAMKIGCFHPSYVVWVDHLSFLSQRESRALVVCNEGCAEGKALGALASVRPPKICCHDRLGA